MLHDLMVKWFEFTKATGYVGVFTMMALESTIVPIPSEIIVPPAAYYASRGELSMTGVVLAGGLGSTFGSSACYWLTYALGRPFVARWGRYFLLPPERLALAEKWLEDFALPGVFLARLLPVVRHLIGFPAGLVRVPFWRFAAVTFVGSTLWTGILAWYGAEILGKPENAGLLTDPEGLTKLLKHDLFWFVGAVAVLGALWLGVKLYARRALAGATPEASP